MLTVRFRQELLELHEKQERLQNKGHDNSHDNHSENVENHEEGPAEVVAGIDRVTLHDYEPVIDHGELKQGHAGHGQGPEVVEVVVGVAVGPVGVGVELLDGGVHAAVLEVHVAEDLEADDGEKVINQEQNNDCGDKSG